MSVGVGIATSVQDNVQPVSGAHRASNGTGVFSSAGEKRPGREADHLHLMPK
jgi:hypothetical protein